MVSAALATSRSGRSGDSILLAGGRGCKAIIPLQKKTMLWFVSALFALTFAVELQAERAGYAAELARRRYDAGLGDFLGVLDANSVEAAISERMAAALDRAGRGHGVLWSALCGIQVLEGSNG